jgi:hypothetical protein
VRSYSGEERCLKRSAEVVWVLATVTAVASVGGRPRQLVVGFQDITDRKAAETALRERTLPARGGRGERRGAGLEPRDRPGDLG